MCVEQQWCNIYEKWGFWNIKVYSRILRPSGIVILAKSIAILYPDQALCFVGPDLGLNC